MKYCIATLIILFSITILDAQNLVERDRKFYAAGTSDVWGWTDGTKEYAIVGTRNGTSFVDVTDPDDIAEIFFHFGNSCTWRDIKTYGNYAYVTQDCNSQTAGLTIFDLNNIQDTVIAKPWRTDGTTPLLRKAHNIFIDEFGYAYLSGHNYGNGGVVILDLFTDPWNPTVVGQYTNTYVHDLYVRNNIMYTAEYSAGVFSIVDASDKANLQVLASQETPVQRSHNIWPSDNGQFVFTTDETTSGNTSIASYDISDLADIKLLDEYNSSPTAVPHNVLVLNDFVVASHYSYGVVILDGTLPDEMVEVGHFDTQPTIDGNNYSGCWGVYPYLPSQNILASDQTNGLYVLTPTYKRAIHIRGTVTDALTGMEIFGAFVEINENNNLNDLTSDISGKFKQGFTKTGDYTVTVKVPGYQTYEKSMVLDYGDVEELNIRLLPIFEPMDTTFTTVEAEESETFCIQTSNFTIDTSLSCSAVNSSEFGDWSFQNIGCLTYSAGNTSGNFVDTICLVVANADGTSFETEVVVFSIVNSTGINDQVNILDNGLFELMQNPVQSTLYLKNNLATNTNLNFQLFDINGRLIKSFNESGINRVVSLSVEDLHKGIYILTIQSSEQGRGFVKFFKQ